MCIRTSGMVDSWTKFIDKTINILPSTIFIQLKIHVFVEKYPVVFDECYYAMCFINPEKCVTLKLYHFSPSWYSLHFSLLACCWFQGFKVKYTHSKNFFCLFVNKEDKQIFTPRPVYSMYLSKKYLSKIFSIQQSRSSRWISARKMLLHCYCTVVTSFLH